jgi:mono/diheme cytochrome c family protein
MKKSIQTPVFMILLILCGAIVLMSTTLKKVQQTTPWVAPASADTIKNPLKENIKSVDEGKKLYAQLCSVCHGDKGKGDGIAAAGLNPKPADHTSEKVQKQSDGAIFWKMTSGRPPMAAYATTLTATQRWQLVNYIRTLKKADKSGRSEAKNK